MQFCLLFCIGLVAFSGNSEIHCTWGTSRLRIFQVPHSTDMLNVQQIIKLIYNCFKDHRHHSKWGCSFTGELHAINFMETAIALAAGRIQCSRVKIAFINLSLSSSWEKGEYLRNCMCSHWHKFTILSSVVSLTTTLATENHNLWSYSRTAIYFKAKS